MRLETNSVSELVKLGDSGTVPTATSATGIAVVCRVGAELAYIPYQSRVSLEARGARRRGCHVPASERHGSLCRLSLSRVGRVQRVYLVYSIYFQSKSM